jgi:hypothetical protein
MVVHTTSIAFRSCNSRSTFSRSSTSSSSGTMAAARAGGHAPLARRARGQLATPCSGRA